MAKEKPTTTSAPTAEEKRLKKEKKEAKKRSETDGVHKSSTTASTSAAKKDKSDSKKKDKSNKVNGVNGVSSAPAKVQEEVSLNGNDDGDVTMTGQLLDTLNGSTKKETAVAVVGQKEEGEDEEDGEVEVKTKIVLRGALVPFANPLADEKVGRKVLKGVKRGM